MQKETEDKAKKKFVVGIYFGAMLAFGAIGICTFTLGIDLGWVMFGAMIVLVITGLATFGKLVSTGAKKEPQFDVFSKEQPTEETEDELFSPPLEEED